MESRDLRTFKSVCRTTVRRSFGFGRMPFAEDDSIFRNGTNSNNVYIIGPCF